MNPLILLLQQLRYHHHCPLKRIEVMMIKLLAFFCSSAYRAGLINFHTSQMIYGKAITNPKAIEVHICAENWPAMVLLCTINGISSIHKPSVPKLLETEHLECWLFHGMYILLLNICKYEIGNV